MTKLNNNHYAIKLFKEMLPYGIDRMRLGDITATLQYPEDDIGVFTLYLINSEIRKGVVFNIFKNPIGTTIIQSRVSGNNIWYEQTATLSSAELFNN